MLTYVFYKTIICTYCSVRFHITCAIHIRKYSVALLTKITKKNLAEQSNGTNSANLLITNGAKQESVPPKNMHSIGKCFSIILI